MWSLITSRSNVSIKFVLIGIAVLVAIGIGRAATTDYAVVSLLLTVGIVPIFLFLRIPSLPAVLIYPLTWIFWAYPIPGLGSPERVIGVLGILGIVLLVLRRERAHTLGMPALIIAGMAILIGSYWVSWWLHADLPRAQEYMVSLIARVVFLFVIYNLLRTADHLRWAIRLLLIASLAAAVLTLAVSLIYGFGYNRDFVAASAASTGVGSLGLAVVMSANFGTAPGILLLGLYPSVKKQVWRIAILMLAFFLFWMAFASQYRREILITLPLLLLFLIVDKSADLRRPAFWLLVVSFLLFFLVLLPFSMVLQNRLDYETQFVMAGTEPRIASFRAGLDAALQSPILGYGPSSYAQTIMPLIGYGLPSWNYSPYNVFIWIVVEAGVLGLSGVLLILLGVFREANKCRNKATGVEGRVLRCAPALLLLIVIWFTFGNAWELSLPWFLMGLILAAARLAKESTGSIATA